MKNAGELSSRVQEAIKDIPVPTMSQAAYLASTLPKVDFGARFEGIGSQLQDIGAKLNGIGIPALDYEGVSTFNEVIHSPGHAVTRGM